MIILVFKFMFSILFRVVGMMVCESGILTWLILLGATAGSAPQKDKHDCLVLHKVQDPSQPLRPRTMFAQIGIHSYWSSYWWKANLYRRQWVDLRA